MSTMKIVFFPLDIGIRDMDEFMKSFVLLSKEKGVQCQLTSPNGAMIKGDKEALLEILDKADYDSFGRVANKISVTIEVLNREQPNR
jgi:uncharacterized protein YqgV (UPF0045/DUF77 family)